MPRSSAQMQSTTTRREEARVGSPSPWRLTRLPEQVEPTAKIRPSDWPKALGDVHHEGLAAPAIDQVAQAQVPADPADPADAQAGHQDRLAMDTAMVPGRDTLQAQGHALPHQPRVRQASFLTSCRCCCHRAAHRTERQAGPRQGEVRPGPSSRASPEAVGSRRSGRRRSRLSRPGRFRGQRSPIAGPSGPPIGRWEGSLGIQARVSPL